MVQYKISALAIVIMTVNIQWYLLRQSYSLQLSGRFILFYFIYLFKSKRAKGYLHCSLVTYEHIAVRLHMNT